MSNKQYSILLVDDDTTLLTVTAMLLENEGYIVETAESATKAITILNRFTPDLIIADIIMPEMNGIELFKEVRLNTQLQNVPFVFLTAQADTESIKFGREIGSDDYLAKPVEPQMLLSIVKGKLKRKDELTHALLQQIEQIKSQLFKLISHEMRTPLTSILGATELLADPHEQLTSKELTTFLEMLQTNAKRLTGMVDDFLMAQKIESGEIEREIITTNNQVNPYVSLSHIVQRVSSKTPNKNIIFENKAPDKKIAVAIHVPHLENILTRLIDNAMKFSTTNGRVELLCAEETYTYLFTVKDYGCGIPKVKQVSLFQRFQQVDREKQEQQGNGLGLFIAKKLSLLNNCNLWFESEEGKGTTFYLRASKKLKNDSFFVQKNIW